MNPEQLKEATESRLISLWQPNKGMISYLSSKTGINIFKLYKIIHGVRKITLEESIELRPYLDKWEQGKAKRLAYKRMK